MARTPAFARPPRPVASQAARDEADAFVLSHTAPALPPEPKAPEKRLTFVIPAGLHAEFKAAAARSGRDMREILIDLLTGYVSGER
jgi:hypothetical protein